jgi:hypothetical protein
MPQVQLPLLPAGCVEIVALGVASNYLIIGKYLRNRIANTATLGCVQRIAVEGPTLCRVFNQAIAAEAIPKRLSYNHGPRSAYFSCPWLLDRHLPPHRC